MPVVQPQVVQGAPPVSQSLGRGTRSIIDFLLQALLSGQIGKVPTGPAVSARPPGVSGPLTQQGQFLSPQALQPIQNAVQAGVVPRNLPLGVSVPSRFGIRPDLTRQLQQSQIASNLALAQQRQRGGVTTIVTGMDASGNPITVDIPSPTVKFPPKEKAQTPSQKAREAEFDALGEQEEGLFEGKVVKVGDKIERGGKTWKIIGFDEDGVPLVDPA